MGKWLVKLGSYGVMVDFSFQTDNTG